MIRLERGKLSMGVSTEVQASAFLNNGWKRVTVETVKAEQESKEIQNQYNKRVINRMSTAELQTLAVEQGIDGANEMTGADLKKVLIEYFNL